MLPGDDFRSNRGDAVMKILFEDFADSVLSQLFRVAYDDTSDFIYVAGNSNFYPVANELLRSSNETIYVYLDAIPGNKIIYDLYRDLVKLSSRNGARLIVFPIVCSEYYFIKSIADIVKNDEINVCVKLLPYFDTELYKRNPRLSKNFEKFCKRVLVEMVPDCMKQTPTVGEIFHTFYHEDCLCRFRQHFCKEQTQLLKSLKLLRAYPCVPVCGGKPGFSPIDLAEVREIQNSMVDSFNDFSDRLAAVDIGKKYFHLFKQVFEEVT